MVIAFPSVSGRSLGSSGGADLVIDKPSGTVEGDWMFALILCSGTGVTLTAPSGWTLDATAGGFRAYSKKAGASEPATYTWSRATQLNNFFGQIVRVTGAHATTPIDVLGANVGSGGSTVLPTVTVTDGFTLLQSVGVMSATTFTPPGGTTEVFDSQYATSNFAGAVGIETVAAGATGSRTWSGGSAFRGGIMYALRDAVVPTGDVSLTESVAVTSAGTVSKNADTSITETVAVSGSGTVGKVAAATVTAAVSIVAAGTVGTSGDVNVNEAVDITASGSTGVTQGTTVSESVDVTAAGTVGAVGNVDVSAAVTITASGELVHSAFVSPVVVITADGVVGRQGDAVLASTVDVDADGVVGTIGAASIPVAVSITADAEVYTPVNPPRKPFAGIIDTKPQGQIISSEAKGELL